MARAPYDPTSVFLNVPFDRDYEPIFIALVGGLVGLGRSPRSVLELPDGGDGRRRRLMSLLGSCGASVHDLSRVSLSGGVPRFNMPFELGLAIAVRHLVRQRGTPRHAAFVFEAEPFRLQRSLSDMNGVDPLIHENRPEVAVVRLLDCFGRRRGTPDPRDLRGLSARLQEASSDIKRGLQTRTLFTPTAFEWLVDAARRLAQRRGLLA